MIDDDTARILWIFNLVVAVFTCVICFAAGNAAAGMGWGVAALAWACALAASE